MNGYIYILFLMSMAWAQRTVVDISTWDGEGKDGITNHGACGRWCVHDCERINDKGRQTCCAYSLSVPSADLYDKETGTYGGVFKVKTRIYGIVWQKHGKYVLHD